MADEKPKRSVKIQAFPSADKVAFAEVTFYDVIFWMTLGSDDGTYSMEIRDESVKHVETKDLNPRVLARIIEIIKDLGTMPVVPPVN